MEKHYSIDPGKGTKMEGCPYSVFEDGHDVQDYIVPPKGYVFIGFKFEPLRNNQIYEGKLVAQYEKSSIKERITTNIWKILIPVFILAVIGLIVLLLVGVFRSPKPQNNTPKKPKTEVSTKPSKKPESTDNSLSGTTKKDKKALKKEQKEKEKKEKRERKEKEKQEKKAKKESKKDTKSKKETVENIQQEPELVAKPQEQVTEQVAEQVTQPQEPVMPAVTDPNVLFKQEFWTLIHNRDFKMDSYHDLYVNNKGKVECEEFDYLRLTILKDYVSFKEWHGKLMKLPENQLQSIESIGDLKNKIE